MRFLAALATHAAHHPRLVSILGAVSGWFSVERIAHAKEWAQLGAATLAALVSLCALVLTAPQAWSRLRGWWHAWRHPRQRNFHFDP